MSASKFEFDLGRAFEGKLDEVDDFVKSVFLEASGDIIAMSPVDKGHFRSNWGMSFGQPDGQTYDTTTAEASTRRVEAKVATYPDKDFPVAYLQNNLPYADRLENGWSGQAEGGMVAVTVLNLTAKYAGRQV
jgi:hypothetical protein